jgi:hypothetical protein
MEGLKADGYRNVLREEEPGLLGIGIEPSFPIGQRGLLVQTDGGNVLYDCVSLIDDDGIAEIERRAEPSTSASPTLIFSTAWCRGAGRPTTPG